jgi:hypothetical protein
MSKTDCDKNNSGHRGHGPGRVVGDAGVRHTPIGAVLRDVFCCHVALREPDAALLLTPDGFQIYLYSKGPCRRAGVGAAGIQYLMWGHRQRGRVAADHPASALLRSGDLQPRGERGDLR